MKVYSIAFSSILAFSLASCSSESVDTTSPEFITVTINGVEDETVELTAGVATYLHIEASDNEGLKQVKLDMHDAFDGHSHGKVSFTPWTYVNVYSLSGKTDVIEDSIVIPSEATAGMYHSVFRVLDQTGNEGDYVERVLIIKNGSEPVVQLSAPAENSSFAAGDVIALSGTVTDADMLDEVHVLLRKQEDVDHFDILDESEHELGDSNVTSFDFTTAGVTLQIPSTTVAGEYQLAVVAVDKLGNQAIYYAPLQVE